MDNSILNIDVIYSISNHLDKKDIISLSLLCKDTYDILLNKISYYRQLKRNNIIFPSILTPVFKIGSYRGGNVLIKMIKENKRIIYDYDFDTKTNDYKFLSNNLFANMEYNQII